MPIADVVKMFRASIEPIRNSVGRWPKIAGAQIEGAWWFAVVALDRGRPRCWLRSKERTADVERLNDVRDEAIAEIYAAAERDAFA